MLENHETSNDEPSRPRTPQLGLPDYDIDTVPSCKFSKFREVISHSLELGNDPYGPNMRATEWHNQFNDWSQNEYIPAEGPRSRESSPADGLFGESPKPEDRSPSMPDTEISTAEVDSLFGESPKPEDRIPSTPGTEISTEEEEWEGFSDEIEHEEFSEDGESEEVPHEEEWNGFSDDEEEPAKMATPNTMAVDQSPASARETMNPASDVPGSFSLEEETTCLQQSSAPKRQTQVGNDKLPGQTSSSQPQNAIEEAANDGKELMSEDDFNALWNFTYPQHQTRNVGMATPPVKEFAGSPTGYQPPDLDKQGTRNAMTSRLPPSSQQQRNVVTPKVPSRIPIPVFRKHLAPSTHGLSLPKTKNMSLPAVSHSKKRKMDDDTEFGLVELSQAAAPKKVKPLPPPTSFTGEKRKRNGDEAGMLAVSTSNKRPRSSTPLNNSLPGWASDVQPDFPEIYQPVAEFLFDFPPIHKFQPRPKRGSVHAQIVALPIQDLRRQAFARRRQTSTTPAGAYRSQRNGSPVITLSHQAPAVDYRNVVPRNEKEKMDMETCLSFTMAHHLKLTGMLWNANLNESYSAQVQKMQESAEREWRFHSPCPPIIHIQEPWLQGFNGGLVPSTNVDGAFVLEIFNEYLVATERAHLAINID